MKNSSVPALAAIRALATVSALLAPGAAMAASSPAPALVGRTEAARPITLSLFLPSRDPAGAQDFAARVGDPNDALFRHYLTPAEYEERFGARQEDYDAVVAWAKSQGLSVGERYVGRAVIPVTGSAASFGAALAVSFNDFRDERGHVFYAADAAPHLPDAIAARLGGVVGLSSASQYMPMFVRVPAGQPSVSSGTGPNGAYSALDLRTIYNVPTLDFDKKTQTLAVFEQGGFDPKDVAVYLAKNNLPSVPVAARSVNGYGTGIDDASVELEAVLDIDMQIAINPQAKKIIVYEDGSDTFQVALLDSLAAMASDGAARSISVSYGQDEARQGADAIAAENTVLTQLAAQGQAVFASSGDNGAYGERTNGPLNVSDPASQPLVTGVGGTTLLSGPGRTYVAEETWNDLGISAGATGGGISAVWPIPSYQLRNGRSVATANGGSATLRNVPDIASVGNPLTGVAVYSKLNGGWVTLGGTSVSAPIWAGFYSLVTAASEAFGFGSPGFANPSLYTLSQSFPLVFPGLRDVVDGENGSVAVNGTAGFNAGYGYDNTTGLGSFSGENALADLVVGPIVSGTTPPPGPRGLSVTATPTGATIKWTGVQGVSGYAVLVYYYSAVGAVAAPLATGTSVTIAGLKPNTTYEAIVVSVSKGGIGYSSENIFTTPKKGA